jgi:hemerythrin-like metal-binding protein
LDKRGVTFLEWDPKYSVHVAEIDRQHKAWFALINGIHAAMLNGSSKAIMRTALAETTQYAFSHFAHEEKLMDEIDYPEREGHVLEHRDLARRAREFADRFEEGKSATMLEYLVFMSEWVKNHTTTTDRKLGDYLAGSPSTHP